MAAMEPSVEPVVRLGVRADRAALVELLRSRKLNCGVGLDESGSWVVMECAEDVDHAGLAVELSATLRTTVVLRRGYSVRSWRDGAELDPEFTALAEVREDIDDVVAALGLPPWLVDPDTPFLVVTCFQNESPAADDFFGLDGAAWLVPAGEGWTLLVPADPDIELAARRSAGLSTVVSRRVTLTLWRHLDQFGYWMCRRGVVVDSQVWNLPWKLLSDVAEREHGDAAMLARETGQADNTVLVRALLRRVGDPDDLLAELIRLLRLPDAIPELLAGRAAPNELPGARWVEQKSVWRVVFGPSRGTVRAMLIAAVASAAVFALVTLVGVLVLASDGAFVDQQGVTADDVLGTIVPGALTLVTVGIALLCRRWLRNAAPEMVYGRSAPHRRPASRWGVVRLGLIVAVAAAVVLGAVTMLGVLVLVSDGAFVDQAGVTGDDVLGTVVPGTLTAAAAGVVLWCRRRLRG